MSRNSLLRAAVAFLLIAVITGLIFNGIPVIKGMPTWVKTSYMNIWMPAIFVIGAGVCLFKRSRIPIVSNKVGPAPAVNNDTPKLTPSMDAPKAPPSNKDPEARLTIS